MSLNEQVALVTGGGRGIGKAISLRLAAEGTIIGVNYAQNAKAAEDVVTEIRTRGGKASALHFDVADEERVETAIKEFVAEYGRLDILVNNAGIAKDGLILRTKREDWQRTIDVNLSGAFYCAKAASKVMVRAKSGRIINISSVIGEMGNAGQVAYAASKSGIFGLTKSLARELGSRGITVNAVTPGFIATEMTEVMSEEQVAGLLKQIPLGKLGQAEDVAELVAFLASAKSAYITGEVLAVNGGLHM
jgi:3-oxoacyl-[acyl-carrier protein] reductase